MSTKDIAWSHLYLRLAESIDDDPSAPIGIEWFGGSDTSTLSDVEEVVAEYSNWLVDQWYAELNQLRASVLDPWEAEEKLEDEPRNWEEEDYAVGTAGWALRRYDPDEEMLQAIDTRHSIYLSPRSWVVRLYRRDAGGRYRQVRAWHFTDEKEAEEFLFGTGNEDGRAEVFTRVFDAESCSEGGEWQGEARFEVVTDLSTGEYKTAAELAKWNPAWEGLDEEHSCHWSNR